MNAKMANVFNQAIKELLTTHPEDFEEFRSEICTLNEALSGATGQLDVSRSLVKINSQNVMVLLQAVMFDNGIDPNKIARSVKG